MLRAQRFGAIVQDLRYAVRAARRSPAFTIVAVLTLALGIGATTTVFSIVSGVLLRPLPYPAPESLVWVAEYQDSRARELPVAWLNFRDWRELSGSFSGLAAYGATTETVLGGETPARATIASVSRDFWTVFPVVPLVGRLTVGEDHEEGATRVAVIREDFWRTTLAGQALGDLRLEIQGIPVETVGVVAAGFDFPFDAEIWVAARPSSNSRTAHNWRVAGRLAAGVTPEQADSELDAITARLVEDVAEDPDFLAESANVVPLREELVGSARQPLVLVFGAALLVLLIACTNLASTLLARGTARAREMAVRASLGAGRGRLVRQLLTESLLLAGLGAVAGLGLTALALRGLRSSGTASLPRLQEIGIDPVVIAFTAGVVVATVLLFGLLPALRSSDQDAGAALRSGDRGASGEGRRASWGFLVAAEVALATVLLFGSGLLLRSFREVLNVDRGFVSEGVMTADVALSLSKYPDRLDHARFYEQLLPALEASGEVERAAVASGVPLSGFIPNGRLELDGDMSKTAVGLYLVASGGFFETLDIPLVAGRVFDERDGPDAPHVAIVSQSFADTYWPGEDAVGRQVTGGGMDEFWEERPFARVVGVVGDARYESLTREPEPIVYFPASQRPGRLRFSATLVAKQRQPALSAVPIMRTTLGTFDPDVPPRFLSMEERVGTSVTERRFLMAVLGGFAVAALLLAVVGIYGVVSYWVSRRTREMGIRLALGAEPSQVRSLVMRGSLVIVAIGSVLGLAAAVGLSRLLGGMLFGVGSADPVTLVAVTGALGLAAWLAVAIPAGRSTRVDPMITMRSE